MIIKKINLNKYFNHKNIYYQLWNKKEKLKELPIYMDNIKTYDFNEFNTLVRSNDKEFASNLIVSLLSGDIYLLKNAFDQNYLLSLKKEASELFKKSKSSFHKIIENCPNFYRNIDQEHSSKYAIHQIKHTHYFYPWNEDFFDLYKETYKRWRLIKYLSGYKEDSWEKNTPKDGIVDRIQIVKYPPNSGELELHQDPYLYQKFFLSVYMSKRDIDYKNGGMYLINKYNKKIELEKNIDIGDMSFGFGSILHGVAKSTVTKNSNPIDTSGRWFIGLYSTVSDYVENRHTGKKANQNA